MMKMKTPDRKPVTRLSVVRNFRQVVEKRDISLMGRALYEFLNLHCGFIAHYNMDGFKATYSAPRDFADTFIRHFDPEHRYFNGVYKCHEEPYKETGFTKAEIKEAFIRIIQTHKDMISKWAEQRQRDERYSAFKVLKEEFEAGAEGIGINCETCGNRYSVRVLKEGDEYNDFGIICCLFCGQQIKLY
jgi:hypothetical protein